MTEDFVENKQEAEVVNNGTEKAGSSMGVVGSISKNKILFMKDWYLYLFILLFMIDPVGLYIWQKPSVVWIFIYVIVTWFLFSVFLFELRILYKYSAGIDPEKIYRVFFVCFIGMYIILLLHRFLPIQYNINQTRIIVEVFFPFFILNGTALSLAILRALRSNIFHNVHINTDITKRKTWLLVVCMALFDFWLIFLRYSDAFYSGFSYQASSLYGK